MDSSGKTRAASIETIERRYQLENKIMHLVTVGDAEGVKELLDRQARTMDLSYRNKDELRFLKNSFIIMNTLMRKAIEFAGVHPLHIHKISERFAIEIERAKTVEAVLKIQLDMIDSYCAVSRLRSGSGYSMVVSRCVEYIMLNYAKRIGPSELAALVHVSTSYLCRRFKKETGFTIIEFVNRSRIDEAKRLLQSEARPLTDIAADVGFESEAYFGRLFQKHVGITPTQFRNLAPSERLGGDPPKARGNGGLGNAERPAGPLARKDR